MRTATDELARYHRERRRLLAGLGGGLAGAVLGPVWARPAWADTALDVQILQTASSLEALAVATYAAALGEGPGGAGAPAATALAGVPALVPFVRETKGRHEAHERAFQARTTALDPGAKTQDAPNPKFLPLVAGADMSTPAKLVDVAAVLEKVATDSYLLDLAMVADGPTGSLLAGVMAIAAQHLAVLRAVAALLARGSADLVDVPLPVSKLMKLPPSFGPVAFPDALHQVGGPDLVADPASGATR